MPEQAIGDGSVVRRFLDAAGRAEIEDAQRTIRQFRSEPEDTAIAELIDERRGSAADLVVQAISQSACNVLGRFLADKVNAYVAAAPGVALVIAGLAMRKPYAVRSGLVSTGVSWISGVKSK